MSDFSNAELGVEGEYSYCESCGLLFHWEQLTYTAAGYFCDDHRTRFDEGDLCIRAPFAGGKYVGLRFWVWSYQLGRVVPALTVDIRRTR